MASKTDSKNQFIWVVEARDSYQDEWSPTPYVALGRYMARREQKFARMEFTFTRLVKYVRGGGR